jgi:PAS domain S-box-containing protein
MQAFFEIVRPLIILHTIVAVGLVFLCRTLARRFPEEQFLSYWAWAWGAYAGYLLFGGASVQLSKLHSLSEVLALASMVAGFVQASLLVLGAETSRHSVTATKRRGHWAIAVAAALALFTFLLSLLQSGDRVAVRLAPREALSGIAFFYCAAAFRQRARSKGSRSALVVTTACAAYGVVDLLLAGATALAARTPSLQPMLFLIYVDLVCQFAVAAGIILQLDEEYQLQQRRLGESEDRFLVLFENNPLPMFVYELGALRFLAVNKAAITHYGYSRDEFLAMGCLDIRPEEDRAAALAALTGQVMGPIGAMGIWRHRKKDGTIIHADIITQETRFRGRPARMAVAVDVSERARLEEQLRQAQKMEAVGQLAGGVAHDFNNLLTLIRGHVEALGESAGPVDQQQKHLEEINRAADQASSLIRQLLAFSRKQVLQPKVMQLNRVVGEIAQMLQRLVGEDIDLEIVADAQLGRVKADRSQMEQVLMNLAVNARDAMPRGGRLTIHTANVEIGADRLFLESNVQLPVGRYALLQVSDTGVGMDQPTQDHIFEPFFTTKEPTKGTGLGLATVYGIVKQSGGWIGVESELGRGTKFKIYLPHVDLPVDAAEIEKPTVAPPARVSGSETILLVEDEKGIRELAGKFLTRSGYTVLAAGDGAEALNLANRHDRPVDLLVTDMQMPKLGGRELVRLLARSTPRMKVLFISGYPRQGTRETGLEEAAVYLSKPFSMEQLVGKVREVLDRPS